MKAIFRFLGIAALLPLVGCGGSSGQPANGNGNNDCAHLATCLQRCVCAGGPVSTCSSVCSSGAGGSSSSAGGSNSSGGSNSAGGSSSTGGSNSAGGSNSSGGFGGTGAGGGAAGSQNTSCGPNEVQCPKGCADLQTDPSNCGSCGYTCPMGSSSTEPACVAGKCTYTCTDPSKTLCPGGTSCKNLMIGEPWAVNGAPTFNDCGACGHLCPVASVCAVATCQSGVCGTAPDPSLQGVGCNAGGQHEGMCESGVCQQIKAYCEAGTLSYGDPAQSFTSVSSCTCNGTTLQTSGPNVSCSTCLTGSFRVDGSGYMATAVCL